MMIPKSLTHRLLEFALTVFAVSFLLHAAWQLLQPLIPVILTIAVIAGVAVITSSIVKYYRFR